MGYVDDVVVALFLVHGLHDLVDLGADGGVVTAPPVQESIILGGRRVEVVRAPHVMTRL
jgi:glutamate synthase domain-containing protein 2